MIIVRPNLYVPGTVIRSAEVNDDFDTLYNDYNGNIDNSNISATAGIEVKKFETLATGAFIFGNAGVATKGAMSGDATVDATGKVTVGGATGLSITDDVALNATVYPTWVTANTGDLPVYVSSTKMSFNPSTGILSTTGLSANTIALLSGTSSLAAGATFNVANTAIVNFDMVTGSSPFTVDSVTVVTNLNADLLDGQHIGYFQPAGTVTDHTHASAGGQGGTTVSVAGGYLSTNTVKIEGSDIDEYATNGLATIRVNYDGYAAGAARPRGFIVYNGKHTPVLGNYQDYSFLSGVDSTSNSQLTAVISGPDSISYAAYDGTYGGGFVFFRTAVFTLGGGALDQLIIFEEPVPNNSTLILNIRFGAIVLSPVMARMGGTIALWASNSGGVITNGESSWSNMNDGSGDRPDLTSAISHPVIFELDTTTNPGYVRVIATNGQYVSTGWDDRNGKCVIEYMAFGNL
jgi:hypothetical protein